MITKTGYFVNTGGEDGSECITFTTPFPTGVISAHATTYSSTAEDGGLTLTPVIVDLTQTQVCISHPSYEGFYWTVIGY